MKKKLVRDTTTDNKTYNAISKDLYAQCHRCRWHGSFWKFCYDQNIRFMSYEDDGTNKSYKQRFRHHYNWKMVSKNRKQWMKKKLLMKRESSHLYVEYITFGFR